MIWAVSMVLALAMESLARSGGLDVHWKKTHANLCFLMIWAVSGPWSLSGLLPWCLWLARVYIPDGKQMNTDAFEGLGCFWALEPVWAPALASLSWLELYLT